MIKKNEVEQLNLQKRLLNKTLTTCSKLSINVNSIAASLNKESISKAFSNGSSVINLGQSNPFIQALSVNWVDSQLKFHLHPDIEKVIYSKSESALAQQQQKQLKSQLINEMARIARLTDESIKPVGNQFNISLNQSTEALSLLSLDLSYLAKIENENLFSNLENRWVTASPELEGSVFPILNYRDYQNKSADEKQFCLFTVAPLAENNSIKGFKNDSLYVVMKGLEPMMQKYQQHPDSAEAEQFGDELKALQAILMQHGYIYSYPASHGFSEDLKGALVFEKPNFYSDFLAATREKFVVKGSKRFATLELSDLEDRILTQNKIETQIHQELLKSSDEYKAAKVDLQNPQAKFFLAPPTKNVLWENLKLSTKEYFRGDRRKVIKWGIDLSGGKSILIGLKDHNNKAITSPEDLSQSVNELTKRVNKMGLSEVDVRVMGENIALDFPSSKGLSASELVQGSSMHFHIVNEKFSSPSSPLYASANKFLQEVWNEALISNKTDIDSINAIAYKQLGGDLKTRKIDPKTEHAKALYQNGFKINDPSNSTSSSQFDDTLSCIAQFDTQDSASWHGQSHPLMVVFNNHALEGSDIENIRVGYDSSQGNLLSFNVKGSHVNKDKGKVNPRETLYNWSSKFSKDQVTHSEYEKYTPSRGWRMAIILNNRVVNDPQLNQPIKDNVQVSGGFTQHEVNKLASDLKAGSLSFTPHILSEENISSDLGQHERMQGITATLVALVLVVALMVVYYRFSGIVASIAVLFNILIIWATLQNFGATLTLSGIAGIILTVGMAVDANVLVFERIREELKAKKSLATAIAVGYKKAFSAIFDSNITTIIAAVILLNFDAGPIKGLAITLTIGIASSMFTALFMTRVFFTKWLEKSKASTLKMANWFKVHAFNFLKHAKWYTAVSSAIIIIGSTLMIVQNKSIVGMDFTGGYSLTVQLKEAKDLNYKEAVEKALLGAGLRAADTQVRELSKPNSLRIQLSSALEQKGSPFYNLPKEIDAKGSNYEWQKNPRISWVVNALSSKNIKIDQQSMQNLDHNWCETSGQLSKTTRNNAIFGLSLAMLFILIYISFRFEVKYAISAIICILHDVMITLAMVAILHLFNVPIQINMQIIAALMTIIGYSLNDTIIVFDRIREEKQIMRTKSFDQIVNHSLSITLNRTLMTSLTTFIVLLALVVLGGAKIFEFSFVMSMGVILGTLSSLFVAPLILKSLHRGGKKTSQKIVRLNTSSIA